MIRLNKFISDSGITSRRKAEELIKQGRITVNNKTVTNLSFTVDPEIDVVSVDGDKIKPVFNEYYLLNKPKGYVSTTSDEKGRHVVIELIKSKNRIFPVGRLDYNTTGVLILTNDGDFTNKLLHPRNKITREYLVKIDTDLKKDDEKRLLGGLIIDGKKGKFISLTYQKKKDYRNIIVSCTEGRNHFIKRMFAALGYNVERLHRKSFAGIEADIPIGSYRKLTNNEITKLKQNAF